MGGISLPAIAAPLITGVGGIVVYAASQTGAANQAANNNNALDQVNGLDVQFRPPQWSVGLPAQTMITVPAAYVQSANVPQSSVGAVNPNSPSASTAANAVPQFLVFDAILRASHSQRSDPTEHPVQLGANLTDHVVLRPAHLILEVLMTDVLPAYATGQWVGNSSKSVSCFQILDALRAARVPLTVTTRLKTYKNMILLDIVPEETVKTMHGFRGTVELQEIFTFGVSTLTVSPRSQTTGATNLGPVNQQAVPTGVNTQNNVPEAATWQAEFGTVLGSGTWSSNPTAGITPGVN